MRGMFRPLEVFVGLRYTRAKRRNHFISFISLISMLGIALGVTALITVLSVMNGFEKELRERILGMTAHATVSAASGKMTDWKQPAAKAEQHPEVMGAAPYIRREAMLIRSGNVHGALVRGVLPELEPKVSEVGRKMVVGELDNLRPGEFGVVLGADLARALRVDVGEKVTMVTPTTNVSPAGVLPRLKRFTVVGLFRAGMYEYDSTLALTHMEDASRLFRTDGAVSGIRLRLDDLFKAPAVSRELAGELPGVYRVTDWTMRHANFFRAIRTEKTAMFVILLLIVGVAAFNIVSTLVMVVTDKQSDIAILRTLGASPGSMMAVFMIQGLVIGAIGTLLGFAGGVSLALNVETIVPAIEQAFGVQFMPADVYYISDLPSEIDWGDVWRICSMAFLLSVVATLYPAWRASRTQPAEALRYE